MTGSCISDGNGNYTNGTVIVYLIKAMAYGIWCGMLINIQAATIQCIRYLVLDQKHDLLQNTKRSRETRQEQYNL